MAQARLALVAAKGKGRICGIGCLADSSICDDLFRRTVSMKRSAIIVFCVLIAGYASFTAWQWRTLSTLEDGVREMQANATGSEPAPVSVGKMPAPSTGRPGADGVIEGDAKASGPVKKQMTRRGKAAPAPPADARVTSQSANQPQANPLTPERRKALLEGRETFNPGPIEVSSIPVTDQTVLTKGQALQIAYAGSWYAGEVIGFEKDGGVHVRYFGWDASWDEVVPRSDLRLDPKARERAVETYESRVAVQMQQ
jgi:hypothetical protein